MKWKARVLMTVLVVALSTPAFAARSQLPAQQNIHSSDEDTIKESRCGPFSWVALVIIEAMERGYRYSNNGCDPRIMIAKVNE